MPESNTGKTWLSKNPFIVKGKSIDTDEDEAARAFLTRIEDSRFKEIGIFERRLRFSTAHRYKFAFGRFYPERTEMFKDTYDRRC